MVTTLLDARVSHLTVTVSVAEALDRRPHDVYLLEVDLPPQDAVTDRFDEVPVLQDLEPVLAAPDRQSPWVVETSRSHRSDGGGHGRAQVALTVARGRGPWDPASEPDLTAAVRQAFERVVARCGSPVGDTGGALSHEAALAESRTAVTRLYPDVAGRELVLSDEEHHAAEGSWSLGLGLPGLVRFRVTVGLVAGVLRSVHVRRMPASEVVDSVGT